MHTGQFEQLARQRIAELSACRRTVRPVPKPSRTRTEPARAEPARAEPARPEPTRPAPSLRTATGWAIVAIGLRIAESGSR